MTEFGEVPHYSFETPLASGEIVDFRNKVLGPAIDFLARKDFTGSAPLWSEFGLQATIPAVGKTTKIEIESFIVSRYDDTVFIEDYMDDRCCTFTLTISSTCSDLVDSLMAVAKIDREDEEFAGEEQGVIEAWQVTEFTFDDEPTVYKQTQYELIDKYDGEIIWDEDDMGPPQSYDSGGSGSQLDEQQEVVLETLEKELGDGFNQSDVMKIKEALEILGVPVEVLYPDHS